MARDCFMCSERIGFSNWQQGDLPLAERLWGNPEVTRYICASGVFSVQDIRNRLELEMANGREYGVEYWPIFKLDHDEFMGCCGLRPHQGEAKYEVGVHLLPEFWRQGYACEALRTVACYAFASLGAGRLFAGHNPHNVASKRLLAKVGFTYVGDEFYEPTGLYHPSYELRLPCAVPSSSRPSL